MENEELNFNEVNTDETNDIIEIKDFNFDGFQVVRGEFFAHLLEPSVTFNKCKLYGIELVVADRFYPSSKLCSCCGNKKTDLKLKDRIYKCDCCGLEIDRDLNVSINLSKYPKIKYKVA